MPYSITTLRIVLSTLCCSFTYVAQAQEVPQSRSITNNFTSGSTHLEQAFTTLSATNKIAPFAQIEYKAGQSITLSPGFEAKAGAGFVAHIGVVSIIATVEGQTDPLTITTYPNPFEETTTISYTLSKAARVTLFISDINGAILSRIVDNTAQEAGRHAVEWRGGVLAAGTYICTVKADQQQVSNRLVRK